MKRVTCWLLIGFVVFAAPAYAGRLGAIKKSLAREFKGKELRLRTDVLQHRSWKTMTTATPEGMKYPNHSEDVTYKAGAVVEIHNVGVYGKVKRISFIIKRPGYKPHYFLTTLVGDYQDGKDKDAEMARMFQMIALEGSTEEMVRKSLARAFYLDGAEPDQVDAARCLKRNENVSIALAAARCGISEDRAREMLKQ